MAVRVSVRKRVHSCLNQGACNSAPRYTKHSSPRNNQPLSRSYAGFAPAARLGRVPVASPRLSQARPAAIPGGCLGRSHSGQSSSHHASSRPNSAVGHPAGHPAVSSRAKRPASRPSRQALAAPGHPASTALGHAVRAVRAVRSRRAQEASDGPAQSAAGRPADVVHGQPALAAPGRPAASIPDRPATAARDCPVPATSGRTLAATGNDAGAIPTRWQATPAGNLAWQVIHRAPQSVLVTILPNVTP